MREETLKYLKFYQLKDYRTMKSSPYHRALVGSA